MYGRVRPDKLLAEPERIMWFCEWGKPFGIDAIVRYVYAVTCTIPDALQNGARIVSPFHVDDVD